MGQQLGFLSLGVCPAGPPPHLKDYAEWIADGNHGTMEFMARHLPLKAHPDNVLEDCRSIIAVALNYNQPNPAEVGHPRIARYALGRDYHKVLRGKLKRLEGSAKDFYPYGKWRACVDSAPIMERDFANLAGLGWFGKNTCLIDSKFGSYFVIGLLLTDLEFETDQPSLGGCGTCQKCIEACPTGAIELKGDRWQVVATKCISYLTIEHEGEIEPQLASQIGDWTFGCDICQDVCPFNEPRDSQPLRAALTTESDFLTTRNFPDLNSIAKLPYEDWDVLTRGSPVRRAGWEGLKRNARINIANLKTLPQVDETTKNSFL